MGVIDLGSNSVRLVIYEESKHASFTEVLNIKQTIRLTTFLDKTKRINKQGIKLIVQNLMHFKRISDFHGVRNIHCIATAVVRSAVNQSEIIMKVKKKTDIDVTVISGELEAYYGYLAVVGSVKERDGIIIDIGGASTEVSCYREGILCDSTSYSFGAITLNQPSFKKDKVLVNEFEDVSKFLASEFKRNIWLRNTKLPVIGIGGSARNLADIYEYKHNISSLNHNKKINQSEVSNIMKKIIQLNLNEREDISGLSKDRVDIIIPAIEAIYQLMKITKAPYFKVSQQGIREGYLKQIYNNKKNKQVPYFEELKGGTL